MDAFENRHSNSPPTTINAPMNSEKGERIFIWRITLYEYD
jgi:hypothetical protein